jgi:hypothetical protein
MKMFVRAVWRSARVERLRRWTINIPVRGKKVREARGTQRWE